MNTIIRLSTRCLLYIHDIQEALRVVPKNRSHCRDVYTEGDSLRVGGGKPGAIAQRRAQAFFRPRELLEPFKAF